MKVFHRKIREERFYDHDEMEEGLECKKNGILKYCNRKLLPPIFLR